MAYQPPFPSAAALARVELQKLAAARLLLSLRSKGFNDLNLLRAMENAPRENFVGAAQVERALRDIALPLPCGQTIESPSEMALALAALGVAPHMRVLEVGTGSGWSAAVLSGLANRVVTLECFDSLARAARERLERLKIANVAALWADGNDISPELGLFDRIIVHAAIDTPPPHLLGALGEGGALIAARAYGERTERVLYRRAAGDRIETTVLGPCRAQTLLSGLFANV
ncbi:protein-L-isoaspartate O-methyltransferase [Rhodoblastus acidophilus]|uniref:Protein-L-isoaspartate O-methyltransferase n=1 Tax=Rhodoblastus acidophilus TaxID=1074 RepID=A0A6N8DN77_RHOAC|nr:protein-L-isoaspartate O-methyltransferase [Rhodoblastus acidophilus]MCW2273849.1 protein-L-isoaspartate(D-aspartate) O-methyltransferase [Rhodoblastus acidophilus]MTV31005.1 protein-L-isoaspartate O-methyltransferase [Rhodoblastus acidophilus]